MCWWIPALAHVLIVEAVGESGDPVTVSIPVYFSPLGSPY